MIFQFSKVDCDVAVAWPNGVEGEVAWAFHSDFWFSDGDG
jgi:hypothetical protein